MTQPEIPSFLLRPKGSEPPMCDAHRLAVLQLTKKQAFAIWLRCKARSKSFPDIPDNPDVDDETAAKGLLLAALAAGNGQKDLVLSIMRDNTPELNAAAETLIGKPIIRSTPKLTKETRAKQKIPKARPLPFDPTHRVVILVTSNPKRAGKEPAMRFDLYKNGMTAQEAMDKGVLAADIFWDTSHNYIRLDPPV